MASSIDSPRYMSGISAAAMLPRRGSSWKEHARMPYTVAVSVLLVYGSWLLFSFHQGHPPRDFLYLGSKFVDRSFASPAISESDAAKHVFGNVGYDGQFAYYIAVDPVNARYYMGGDNGGGAGYRYGRIVYPMTARVLALGQPNLIPYTMLLINWLSLGFGTLVLAAWLRLKGASPWLASIYGFYPGLFVAFHRDLNEPMADALVVLAIYLFSFGGKRRLLWSAVSFALAILTRDTSAIFAVVYGLALFFGGRGFGVDWRRVLQFLLIALAPFGLYEIFLRLWLPGSATASQKAGDVLSFHGIFAWWPWQGEQLDMVFAVVLPGVICAAMGVWAVTRRVWPVEVWSLLANILAFLVLLNPIVYQNYVALGRLHGAIVLAALCCVPAFGRVIGHNRAWLWVASILWFLPWYLILPQAFGGPWIGDW